MNNNILGNLSRRKFLSLGAQTAGSAAMLASLGGIQTAAASDLSGYLGMVCLYMTGGNDGFNTVIPTSPAAYTTYAKSRSNLAISKSSLLGLSGTASDGNSYGLHPSMPEMQSLFNAGNLAVVSNVGTLVQPMTQSQFLNHSGSTPLQLFSHSDQQTQWWSSVSDQQVKTGWAGRIADLCQEYGYTSQLPLNINVGGANYWQDGSTVQPYVLGINGAPTLVTSNNPYYRNGLRSKASLDLLSLAANDSNPMIAQHAAIAQSASSTVGVVNSALAAEGPVKTTFPSFVGDCELGAQLRQVANLIKARGSLGDTRQIFFVRIGGFDFHNDQLANQANLLKIVSQNVAAFWKAMNEIGAQDEVTLFTASEFGRTLNTNNGGTDHGWGSHHFVMGGGVKGGFYGQMPSLALGGPDDVGEGRILPTTSVDQYAATLANWMTVPDSFLDGIFPNLPNFSTRNLGFL